MLLGSGAGPLICSARGRSVLAVLGPPGLCLVRGRPDPGLCPGALCSRACAVGFVLPPCSSPPVEPLPRRKNMRLLTIGNKLRASGREWVGHWAIWH
ncbi:unnamed protein product [Nyctereutes procyonoides]|uniref:(raccoon dog) hypothetical protein n=1 Tax=Nyctereutes procyonoides TaxID=34880 RepID=A0A811Z0E9_NYCPR|nr:unnamed protein product [Nyctereutes procyonoides]